MKPLSYLVCQVTPKVIEMGIEAITDGLLGKQLAGCFDGDPILQV
ncbi:hypothetical protein [Streptomyces sp. Ag109_G2-15]|nr:hypothetical protein [Streptomyces sp. Ag109_G2-15]SOD91516.1 hypothetical protein SAMN06272765_7166 [Streptomyces sp. Ag109_G2-15]